MNSLGIDFTPDDGHLVAGTVAVIKVIDPDGCVALHVVNSDGLAVFERIGMLRTAEALELRDAIGEQA